MKDRLGCTIKLFDIITIICPYDETLALGIVTKIELGMRQYHEKVDVLHYYQLDEDGYHDEMSRSDSTEENVVVVNQLMDPANPYHQRLVDHAGSFRATNPAG